MIFDKNGRFVCYKGAKYQGNLSGYEFLKVLHKQMDKDVMVTCCSTCHHINGDCSEKAKKGTCKAYKYRNERTENRII